MQGADLARIELRSPSKFTELPCGEVWYLRYRLMDVGIASTLHHNSVNVNAEKIVQVLQVSKAYAASSALADADRIGRPWRIG